MTGLIYAPWSENPYPHMVRGITIVLQSTFPLPFPFSGEKEEDELGKGYAPPQCRNLME